MDFKVGAFFVEAAERLFEVNFRLTVFVDITIYRLERSFFGVELSAFVDKLFDLGLDSVGIDGAHAEVGKIVAPGDRSANLVDFEHETEQTGHSGIVAMGIPASDDGTVLASKRACLGSTSGLK